MSSRVWGWMLMVAGISLFAACQVGKKPTRRQVKIEDPSAKRRRGNGLITVDTNQLSTIAQIATDQPAKTATLNNDKVQLIEKLQPLWNRSFEYKTFSGKADMHFEGNGEKQKFDANFRISKDKIIWVSITALGLVPVARAYITPDSVLLVNYLQRTAYRMHISEINKLMPAHVDFFILQNLIVGDIMQKGGQPTDATDFGGSYTLTVEEGNVVQQVSYNKVDSTMRTLQMLSKDGQGPTGMMQYGKYELTNGRKFATSRVVNLTNAGAPYYLDMNFKNVEFDKQLEFPFSIPKNYTMLRGTK